MQIVLLFVLLITSLMTDHLADNTVVVNTCRKQRAASLITYAAQLDTHAERLRQNVVSKSLEPSM